MQSVLSGVSVLGDDLEAENAEDREFDEDLEDMVDLGSSAAAAISAEDSEANKDDENKKKTPVWKKPEKKKKKGGGGKQKQKGKKQKNAAEGGEDKNGQEDGSGSDESDVNSDDEDDKDNAEQQTSNVEEEDEEAEWQKFQRKLNKREKALEGKSRISHSVHCPYFTDDKQEFWWVYIADRKNHALITPPNHVTSLKDREEVELKFTAPHKPGHYTFTVFVRSDSYMGVDLMEDIKLDVHEAREAPTDHPQWEFEDDDEEEKSKDEDSADEFATDDEFDDEDGDDEDEDED